MLLGHGQKDVQGEIIGPGFETGVVRQILVHPRLIPGTDFLAAVAAVDPGPHGLAQLQRGHPGSVIRIIGDAFFGVHLLGRIQGPGGTGGQAGVLVSHAINCVIYC